MNLTIIVNNWNFTGISAERKRIEGTRLFLNFLCIYFFSFASSKLKQGFQTGVFSRKKYSLILTVNGKLLDDLRRRKPEGDWGQVC